MFNKIKNKKAIFISLLIAITMAFAAVEIYPEKKAPVISKASAFSNFGMFWKKCGGQTASCSGNCFNLQTDFNNCGACGNGCDDADSCTDDSCASGSCSHVPNGGTPEVCNGVDDDCDAMVDDGFDFNNDPTNCGSCNVFCATTMGEMCQNGLCTCVVGAPCVVSCCGGLTCSGGVCVL